MNLFVGFGIFGKGLIPFILVLFCSIGSFVYLIKNKKLEIYLTKLEKIWISKGWSKFIFEIIVWIITMIIWTCILAGTIFSFYLLGIIN